MATVNAVPQPVSTLAANVASQIQGTAFAGLDVSAAKVVPSTGGAAQTPAQIAGTAASAVPASQIGIPSGVAPLGSVGQLLSGAGAWQGIQATSNTATPVRLTADGNTASATNSLPLPVNGGAMRIHAQATARRTDTHECIHWDATWAVRRAGAGQTPVLSPGGASVAVFDADADMAGCTLTIAADQYGSVVTGTGVAGVTIAWKLVLVSVSA